MLFFPKILFYLNIYFYDVYYISDMDHYYFDYKSRSKNEYQLQSKHNQKIKDDERGLAEYVHLAKRVTPVVPALG